MVVALTNSFVVALAIGAAVTTLGAVIMHVMVWRPVTAADLARAGGVAGDLARQAP